MSVFKVGKTGTSSTQPTIGKVIKRHNFYFQKQGRIYHNPGSKWVLNQAKKNKRLRIKHPPKYQDLGHIQSDKEFINP